MVAESEKVLERKLRDRVKKLDGLAFKFVSPGFMGVPDRIVLMPGARVYFAELKTTGKKPTKIQLYVHGLLKKLGFEVWVIDRTEILEDFLNMIAC